MSKDEKSDFIKEVEAKIEAAGYVENEFAKFGFKDELNEGIQAAGFKQPSEIQSAVIPAIMEGRDVIGQAQTGTGKTAAFSLPVMNVMNNESGVEMLVIAPTRELAMQVSDEIYRLGRFSGVRTGTVCGGQSYSRQIGLINKGISVVSATPGRMLDLLQEGKLKNFKPSFVILDEADEMLDMGFIDDIKAIFNFLPEERQTLLFSATMPKPIKELASNILKDPVSIKTTSNEDSTSSNVEQLYCVMEERERQNAIVRLMDDMCPQKEILFCRTRGEVDRLSNSLGARGFNAKGLHGDMEQAQRNEVMNGFRKSQIDILVATDVAARGLDVLDVTHVFNYHMPFDTKSYIHRIGRTGRASNKGTAITFVTPMEFNQLHRIQRQSGAKIDFTLIPSRKELRKNRMLRMIDEVYAQEVDPEGVNMVHQLEEGMDLSEIAYKLASLLLNQQNEAGPERIGIDEKEVKALHADAKRNRRKRFPRKRNRSRNSGGGGGRPRKDSKGGDKDFNKKKRKDFSKSKPKKRKK